MEKPSVVQTYAIENNKRLKQDLKSVAQTLAKLYSNLAESLLKNLRNSTNKFDMNSVHQFYKNPEQKVNFDLSLTKEIKVFQKQQELIRFGEIFKTW